MLIKLEKQNLERERNVGKCRERGSRGKLKEKGKRVFRDKHESQDLDVE